ncbi:MAG: DUF2510 domain-containing protein [Actinomycetes bacterium]
MLIIWGFKNSVTTMAMLTLACRNGHTAAHRLVRTTRRFTLFFIPLFSVRHRWFTICAQCGLDVAWQKEDAEAAAAHAVAAGGGPVATAPTDPAAAPVDPYAGNSFGGNSFAAAAFTGNSVGPDHSMGAGPVVGEPGPSIPAGWYPCPTGQPTQERWWDGRGWTENVR